ncbi:hypothetical protein FXO38_14248 [Capsicum annuum]|nr:hypothetical protein FXO38_14248 [Capsicum annuum]KAF3678953.1 hypothetical protein FXO37_04124 [Capsicum annuum]
MALMVVGHPPPVMETGLATTSMLGIIENPETTYADTIKPLPQTHKPIPLKQIAYLHGELRVVWKDEEINRMMINEDLQYVVIVKNSYGWPEIQDLRRLITNQSELKGILGY